MENFQADMIANSPQWVLWWVQFMGVVILLSIPFSFVRVEARWALLAFVVSTGFMYWLYFQFGYERILGLGHIPSWTVLAIYLWQRRDKWRVKETISGKYLAVLFPVLCASLILDYADVIRYLMGERL